MNRFRENIDEFADNQVVVESPVALPRKKKRWKKWFLRVSIVTLLLGVLSLFVFAGHQQKASKVWKVDIEVREMDGLFFITSQEISSLLQSKGDSLIGKSIQDLNMDALHAKLSGHPCVKMAQVYTTVDGRCVVKVDQRRPVARVFNEDGTSFFIDEDGWMMPYTGAATMNLPLFVGNIKEKLEQTSILELRKNHQWAYRSLADDIYFLALHIRNDEFLSAQIDHIFIDASRNVQLIPRVGDHRIYLGNVEGLDVKFKKLLAFYASAMKTHDLNQYKSIHLEYEGQVVCERKI